MASEIDNGLKHIIGQYQPYGLYSHEPNTLLLAPVCIRKLVPRITKDLEFGIDSEIQDLTRKLLKKCSTEDCAELMKFSAFTILATSMKRTGKPFYRQFSGKWSETSTQFEGWTKADIRRLHGLPQGIMNTNKWANCVATSFAKFRKHDGRSHLAKLYRLFDPYYMCDHIKDHDFPNSFYTTLLEYNEKLNMEEIKNTFQMLSNAYDENTASCMVTIAFNCGQFMCSMYLAHLTPPKNIENLKQESLSRPVISVYQKKPGTPDRSFLKTVSMMHQYSTSLQ